MEMILDYVVTAEDFYVKTAWVYGSQWTGHVKVDGKGASKGKELAIYRR